MRVRSQKAAEDAIEPRMKTCTLCGYDSDEEGSFCPVCGEEYK